MQTIHPEIIFKNSGFRNQKDLLLERACHNGEFDRVERTFANSTFGRLSRKKDVYHIEKDVMTNCLKLSIEQGHVEIMDFLIDLGADFPDFSVKESLLLCCRQNHLRMLKVFYDRFDPPTAWINYCLLESIDRADLNTTKFLLENKADISGKDGVLILEKAIYANKMDNFKLLLDYGIDVSEEIIKYVCKYNINRPYLDLLINRKLVDINHPTIPVKIRTELYEKKFYRKWRRIYLKNWVRKVLIPLYYSPQFQGGILAKRDILNVVSLE